MASSSARTLALIRAGCIKRVIAGAFFGTSSGITHRPRRSVRRERTTVPPCAMFAEDMCTEPRTWVFCTVPSTLPCSAPRSAGATQRKLVGRVLLLPFRPRGRFRDVLVEGELRKNLGGQHPHRGGKQSARMLTLFDHSRCSRRSSGNGRGGKKLSSSSRSKESWLEVRPAGGFPASAAGHPVNIGWLSLALPLSQNSLLLSSLKLSAFQQHNECGDLISGTGSKSRGRHPHFKLSRFNGGHRWRSCACDNFAARLEWEAGECGTRALMRGELETSVSKGVGVT